MTNSLVADTWLLIQLQWLLAWNTFRSAKLIRKIFTVIGILAATLGGGSFSAVIGYGAGALLRNFPEYGFEPLIPGLLLTAVTVILLINSFGIALGSLFFSNDLEMLMAAPVSRRAVLISKVLDGMAFYLGLALMMGAPGLITYGLGLGYGPFYYIFTILSLLATPLLPAAVGSLLVMIVARFAPARRVREVMGLAAALFGVTCSIVSNTSRFWSQNNTTNQQGIDVLLTLVRRVADFPIPTMVAGHGLTAAGVGNIGGALLNLSGYALMSVGSFALVVWLADMLYSAGWLRMQSSGSANRNAKRVARDAKETGLLGTASPSFAIALKDWRVLPRDLRNFAQFLAPLFILPVIYINFFGDGREGFNAINQANELAQGAADFTNVFVAAGVLATAALVVNRSASIGISMEGKSYWLLKTAPISGYELLLGKFFVALVPFAILSTLMFLGVAIWRGFSIVGIIYGLFGILLIGAGNLAIEVGMAVPWANLKWDDPRRMSSGWGVLIAFIVSAISGVLAGASLCLPLIVKVLAPELEWLGWIIGPLLAVTVIVGVVAPLVWIGLKRLPYVGEA